MDEKKTKVCTKCHKEKPLEDFWFRVKGKGNRIARCKDCRRIQNLKNKERRRIKNLKYPQIDTFTKICFRCDLNLPSSSFSKCLTNKDALSGICKKCVNTEGRKRRLMKRLELKEEDIAYCQKCGERGSRETQHLTICVDCFKEVFGS